MVVLIAGILGSCTASDNLPEADENAAKENGDFFMDSNMHYSVDGLITSDKDLIKKSFTKAWNTHYDYSKNRVVISTNSTEFEKYKTSNLEFKKHFEGSGEFAEVKLHPNTNMNATTSRATATASDYPHKQFNGISHPNHLMWYIYDNKVAPYTPNVLLVRNVSKTDTTTNTDFAAHSISSTGTATSFDLNPYGSRMFHKAEDRKTGDYTMLRNTSNSASKSVTFYKLINYGGTGSVTITLAKNTQIKYTYSTVGFIPASFK